MLFFKYLLPHLCQLITPQRILGDTLQPLVNHSRRQLGNMDTRGMAEHVEQRFYHCVGRSFQARAVDGAGFGDGDLDFSV